MIAFLSGLAAGALHVLSGPDHLAAVAPLSLDRPAKAWLTGLRWGCGHAGGVLLVAALALIFRELVPVDLVSQWSERLVGIVLIGIGLWGLRQAFRYRLHTHQHTHHGSTHIHVHVHASGSAHGGTKSHGHRHTHAAVAVGALHGLAGSSHFLAVIPALAFQTRQEAILYLAAYGLATVFSMAGFSSVIGLTAPRLMVRGTPIYRALMGGCSAGAVGIGLFWLLT